MIDSASPAGRAVASALRSGTQARAGSDLRPAQPRAFDAHCPQRLLDRREGAGG